MMRRAISKLGSAIGIMHCGAPLPVACARAMSAASSSSEPIGSAAAGTGPLQGQQSSSALEKDQLIRRMLYRSKQRGWLELDLLVGMWAQENLTKLDSDLLQEFDRFLVEENPDMFKYLTGQREAPEPIRSNRAYLALKAHVDSNLLSKRHTDTMSHPSKEWVRGWDDSWRGSSAKAAK